MTLASARRRYVTDAIQTVSPQQLVVMLYDRLLLDITRAGEALERRDLETVNAQLTHAQDIVLELESSLNPDLWSGGPTLAALYRFLHNELITANVTKDAARIEICRGLVDPLATAWRQAASGLAEGLTSRAATAQQLHQDTQSMQAVTT
ncbi:flagellar export chaperone FliS [Euzebya rosea]|uniref:flagellar export chaperone FliS n=1 Tax=Euzebya rosea TaxID=2052804 RepID=UPI000D3E2AC6|nr:flagellar export chaperone FliS [Euzebya rosea]